MQDFIRKSLAENDSTTAHEYFDVILENREAIKIKQSLIKRILEKLILEFKYVPPPDGQEDKENEDEEEDGGLFI